MKGIDKKTMLKLVDAFDISADKVETWQEMLADEDTKSISEAIDYIIRTQIKAPRVADVISFIKSKEKNIDTKKEKWTKEELELEIQKAKEKNMVVVVEKFKENCSKIYWLNPYFLPKNARKYSQNALFFYILN